MSDGAPDPRAETGLRGALARAGAATIGLVQTRIELAALEFAESREHAKQVLLLAVIGGVFLAFAVAAASAAVVIVFWDDHRIAAIAGITLLYVVIGSAALFRLRDMQRTAPPPFAATLAELERDRQWLAAGLKSPPGDER